MVLMCATERSGYLKAVLRSKGSPVTAGLLNSPLWLIFSVEERPDAGGKRQ